MNLYAFQSDEMLYTTPLKLDNYYAKKAFRRSRNRVTHAILFVYSPKLKLLGVFKIFYKKCTKSKKTV